MLTPAAASTDTPVQIEVDDAPDGTFSEPHVMRSAAGFYVGTTHKTDGFWSPYDRYTDYMPTRKAAQEWLDRAIASDGL